MSRGSGEAPRPPLGARARERTDNRSALLRALRSSGPTTRHELTRRTGLSTSTVASLVTELELAGTVTQVPVAQGGSGRRPLLVALSRSAVAALALDIGPRHIAAAVATPAAGIRAELSAERPPRDHPRTTRRLVDAMTRRVVAESGADPAVLLGATVALDRVSTTPTACTLSEQPGGAGPAAHGGIDAGNLVRVLGEQWHLPVAVESRARLGALAESSRSPEPQARTLLNVTCDGRVDLGITIGGRIHRGHSGTAGMIGHHVVRAGGRLCPCGRRGCLDAYVDRSALQRAARLGPVPSRTDPTDEVLLLAQAVAAASLVIDPSVVVLGGSLADLGEPFAAQLRAGLAAWQNADPVPPLVRSTLRGRAPLLGALDLWLCAGERASDVHHFGRR
ncbi:ROK family protein [Kitasatospora terrestris]|uniref:ROK family transcriptional regulator n=1 Tax=Kitasatospora terrestris TaxID=258051 RepID=A0ABP9DEX4_9ACTN